MIDEKKLSEVVNEGLGTLNEIFKSDNPSKEQITRARLASSVLSTATRLEATKNSMISLRFRVAQGLLKSTKEKREYLLHSSPELKLLKG